MRVSKAEKQQRSERAETFRRLAKSFEERGEAPLRSGELWAAADVRDLRVMMLCFSAAMAETGDL